MPVYFKMSDSHEIEFVDLISSDEDSDNGCEIVTKETNFSSSASNHSESIRISPARSRVSMDRQSKERSMDENGTSSREETSYIESSTSTVIEPSAIAAPIETMNLTPTKTTSNSFLQDRTPVRGMQDISGRMRAGDAGSGANSSEDERSLFLLNKLIGEQILVQCTEQAASLAGVTGDKIINTQGSVHQFTSSTEERSADGTRFCHTQHVTSFKSELDDDSTSLTRRPSSTVKFKTTRTSIPTPQHQIQQQQMQQLMQQNIQGQLNHQQQQQPQQQQPQGHFQPQQQQQTYGNNNRPMPQQQPQQQPMHHQPMQQQRQVYFHHQMNKKEEDIFPDDDYIFQTAGSTFVQQKEEEENMFPDDDDVFLDDDDDILRMNMMQMQQFQQIQAQQVYPRNYYQNDDQNFTTTNSSSSGYAHTQYLQYEYPY